MPKVFNFNLYACLITLTMLLGCDQTQEIATKEPIVRPVKLISVAEAHSTRVSQFPAVIGANRQSEMSFQVGGMLKELAVNESQRLKKGDLIARLDQRDFASALDSATAQYSSAKKEYQRAQRLAAGDAIAANVLEQRKTQRDVSKAQLDQAKKALTDSVLLAPFDGVVAQKLVNQLQTVSPGQVVVNYMSDDSLEATIDLPASFLAKIPKDKSNENDRQAFVILDAAPNQLIKAEFKEASLLADAASQTYAITFAFQPPENLLVLPGMNATVELRINKQSEQTRVAIPLFAITQEGDDRFVWIVDRNQMTVSKRLVDIEDGVGEMMVVISGLNENDTIVGAGTSYLSEGMQIKEWK